MKKFLSAILAVVLTFSLSAVLACNSKPEENTNQSSLKEEISSNSSINDNASSNSSVEEQVVTYLITFANEDGTVLQQTEVEEGSMPEYTGATPSKAATAQYTYTFAGWDKPLSSASAEVTYTAIYSSVVNKYVVKFVNENGNVLQESEVEYGKTPVYTGTTPVKAEDDNYTYNFAGWDKEISAVTGEATYVAIFDAEEKSDASDDPFGSDIY